MQAKQRQAIYRYVILTSLLLALTARTGVAADGDLAAANQAFANPLADVTISILENNALLFGGDAVSGKRLSNVTIFDPVIPQPLGDWGSLVHRPIIPYFSKLTYPDPNGGFEEDNGLGDITYFAAFSPKPTSPFVWGAGPIFRFPTATEDELGSEKYSAGLMAVGLYSSKKLSLGFLQQNLFSFAGEDDRNSVQSSTLQYFYFYNFNPRWGIGAAPLISVDWEADDKTSFPIGIGITRSFLTNGGKTPNRLLFEVDYYVNQSDQFGPKWNFRIAWGRFLPSMF